MTETIGVSFTLALFFREIYNGYNRKQLLKMKGDFYHV